jgi:alkylation response protein AidB-like acyl-CoA dehydrogenase
MDFEFTEEQEALRDSVHDVLARECGPTLARVLFEGGSAPEQPWKSAVELGWTAITVPETHGGLGLGFEELGPVIEEHGRFLATGPYVATVSQFLPLMREAGDQAQRARFLPRVAEGALRGALALAGPSGTGLCLDPSLRARRADGGWILAGSRHWVLDGDSADEIALAARVEEGDGCGLFVVPRSALATERVDSLDASRSIAHLTFDAVRVPAERTLGTPGRCAESLERALDEARVALALEVVGACDALLDLSLAHAREREQFDQPIGAFQAIQHKCADMFVALEKARATAYFAMMTIGEDDPRRRIAASMAKASAGDCEELVCKEAIQIHGGIGMTWESDVHLFVKRAKTAGALLGTAEEHRARIAALLGV